MTQILPASTSTGAGQSPSAQPAADAAELERLRSELEGLRAAMQSRAVIEQAKGVLIARFTCSSDAAFAVLTRWSQTRQTKLRHVAATVVALAERGRPGELDSDDAHWLHRQLCAAADRVLSGRPDGTRGEATA